MAYSAASIANAFLSRSFRDKNGITPMKIQKLVYLAHGYSLALQQTPLVDEFFEAWKFGPVLPSLYHECKKYNFDPINDYLRDYNYISYDKNPASVPDDGVVNQIIDFVWSNYGSVSPIQLSGWTHEKGGPWDTVITENNGVIYRNQEINNKLIEEYFNKMIENK